MKRELQLNSTTKPSVYIKQRWHSVEMSKVPRLIICCYNGTAPSQIRSRWSASRRKPLQPTYDPRLIGHTIIATPCHTAQMASQEKVRQCSTSYLHSNTQQYSNHLFLWQSTRASSFSFPATFVSAKPPFFVVGYTYEAHLSLVRHSFFPSIFLIYSYVFSFMCIISIVVWLHFLVSTARIAGSKQKRWTSPIRPLCICEPNYIHC